MKVVRKDMKCPKCLKEIPEDNFCGFCGKMRMLGIEKTQLLML